MKATPFDVSNILTMNGRPEPLVIGDQQIEAVQATLGGSKQGRFAIHLLPMK